MAVRSKWTGSRSRTAKARAPAPDSISKAWAARSPRSTTSSSATTTPSTPRVASTRPSQQRERRRPARGSSLIVGNSADNGSSAGVLIVHGAGATIAGNTVSENTTTLPQGIGGLVFSGNSTCNCAVVNSIFWDNTAIGLWLGNSNVALEYNDIGTPGGSPADTDIGNVSIAPQFADRDGGDFHLAGDSTLFGLTPDPIGRLDLDGHPLAALRARGSRRLRGDDFYRRLRRRLT